MTKVCKNCEEIVTPDPMDDHCPNCGAKVGYTVSKTLTLKWRIEDERDEIKRTIDEKFKEYDKYIKQGKNVEFYKKLKLSLEKQVPEFLAQAEKNAKERLEKEEKEREQHKVSFTADAIIGSQEQRKIKEQEDYIRELEYEKNQLQAKLQSQKLIDEKSKETIEQIASTANNIDVTTKKIHDRLSPRATITLSLIIGICASFIASGLFKIWIDSQPTP